MPSAHHISTLLLFHYNRPSDLNKLKRSVSYIDWFRGLLIPDHYSLLQHGTAIVKPRGRKTCSDKRPEEHTVKEHETPNGMRWCWSWLADCATDVYKCWSFSCHIIHLEQHGSGRQRYCPSSVHQHHTGLKCPCSMLRPVSLCKQGPERRHRPKVPAAPDIPM
ncbi:hypothetical protein CBL_04620 [Carabus blaptoides fortunei]